MNQSQNKNQGKRDSAMHNNNEDFEGKSCVCVGGDRLAYNFTNMEAGNKLQVAKYKTL